VGTVEAGSWVDSAGGGEPVDGPSLYRVRGPRDTPGRPLAAFARQVPCSPARAGWSPPDAAPANHSDLGSCGTNIRAGDPQVSGLHLPPNAGVRCPRLAHPRDDHVGPEMAIERPASSLGPDLRSSLSAPHRSDATVVAATQPLKPKNAPPTQLIKQ
jgi:hypothetical protein